MDNGMEFGDFIGNGLAQIVHSVYWTNTNIRTGAWINKGIGWEYAPQYIPPDYIINNGGDGDSHGQDNGVRFVDLTGSGLGDMVESVYWSNTNIRQGAWLNTGNGWISAPQYIPPDYIANNRGDGQPQEMDNGIRFIDFTGSGLVGIVQSVYWNDKNIRQGAWINTGNGWVSVPQYIPPDYIANNAGGGKRQGMDNGIRFVDLTGSGIADIVHSVYWTDTNIRTGAWLNRAKKFPDYLISITDGLGSKTAIDYEPLSGKAVNVYTKEHDAQYPNMDWQGPMYVVAQTSSETASNDAAFVKNNNGQHVTNYYYKGAKFNHLGLGFLGFHTISSADQTTGIKTTTTYSQDINRHLQGKPIATETRLSDATLISAAVNNYDLKVFGSGNPNETYYLPYVKQVIKDSYTLAGIKTSTVTTNTVIDNFANPTQIEVITQNADRSETYSTLTQNTYNNNPDKWFLGELVSAKVTKSGTGLVAQTRTSSFSYDSNTSLIMQTIAQPNNEDFKLTTDYKRDTFGNVISTTISGKGIESRTSTVKYDDYGRFAIQATNALNQSVSSEYDPRFGTVITSTDVNGLVTHNQYDAFGRLVGQTAADGAQSDVSYSWFSSVKVNDNVFVNCSYVVTTHLASSITQNEYYDRLGRKVATTTQDFKAKNISQYYYYDDLGRLVKQSLPFYTGDPVYNANMQYDVLGRLVQTTYPDNTTATIAYNPLATTTTNQLGQKLTKQINILEQLVKTVDNIGSITTYKYDAYGNMTDMIDSVGHVSKIYYDLLGRKTAIDDPDKGKWSYGYDILGQLTSQKDAKGQITTMSYDKLGRMISRTDIAGTSTWEYDTAVHGIGKLAKVTGVAGVNGKAADPSVIIKAKQGGLESYTRSYAYDELSRPNQVTTIINGNTYSSSYTFDANSRVATETYPNGLQVKNNYSLGYLAEIIDNKTGKSYWKLNNQDAALRTTSETKSNGLITNYTYDPKSGFLTDIDTVLSTSLQAQEKLFPEQTAKALTPTISHSKKRCGRGGIMSNLSCKIAGEGGYVKKFISTDHYEYDAIGNVKNHSDDVYGYNEAFVYDNLNRLTSANSIGRFSQSYQYDALGNIMNKSDVGDYKYGAAGAGPHAVTSITGPKPATFQYDPNGDQVSATISGVMRNITYSSFNKPLSITTPNASINFYYDADRKSFERVEKVNNKTTTTFYLGNYEIAKIDDGKTITTQQKAYVGLSAILITNSDGSTTTTNTYELTRNNIGSTTNILDGNANVIEHFEYTPFGEQTQTKSPAPENPITHHGFTGHEEIEIANLIHMDGRIYDPLIGRFLTADPFVQAPENSQSLNRYSYCINNPLTLTDPSGFGFWHSLVHSIIHNSFVRIAIGVVVGLATAALCILAPPLGFGMAAWEGLGIGAGAAFLTTAGLGMLTGHSFGQSFKEGLIAGVVTLSIGTGLKNMQNRDGSPNLSNNNSQSSGPEERPDGGADSHGSDAFTDHSFSDSINYADSSGNVFSSGNMNSILSDRLDYGAVVGGTAAAYLGDYSNGAKSDANAEAHGAATRAKGSPLTVDEGQSIVDEAVEWKNTPYAFNGTTYAGKKATQDLGGDCSGITHAAYVAAGYDYQYMNVRNFANSSGGGHFVQVTNPQAGDVAVWSQHGNHHMGIYAGDGQMWTTHVHANNGEFGLSNVHGFFRNQPDPNAYYRYSQ